MIKLLKLRNRVHQCRMRGFCGRWLLVGAIVITALRPPCGAAESGSWVLSASGVSQYMFRGLRLGGPAFQPSAEYTLKNGGVGLWGSTPLADKVPGRSDPEIDPYAWWRVPVSEQASVQAGFTGYWYPRADRERGFHRATFEPNLGLNYTFKGVVVTPKLYYDTALRGPTAELSAASALPLGALGTELDVLATVGTYRWTNALSGAGPATKYWGDYWQIGATIPYQIGASRLSLGFAYAAGEDAFMKSGNAPRQANPLAARRGVVTLTYSRSF